MHGRLLLATTALLLAPASGAGAAASRPCTADDLQGSRAPAMLRDHGLDTQDGPLIAGTRYRVVVVQELATGDRGRAVDGSIAVSAPSGPALDQGNEDGRPVYDFTPTAAGTVRLVVSWEEEIGSPGSGDVCAASQSFDLPVPAPTAPKVKGRFSRGDDVFGSSFVLRLTGTKPQDRGKVSVVLRARRGATTPPPPSASPFATFTFTPNGNGGFTGRAVTRRLARTFQADTTGAGVRIFPYANIAFGRTLRFAFSIDVLQNGRRIGGMRSGASCRRVQLRQRSAVKCRAVGLKVA
ncbi:MAG TPA: hypothetical protein VF549_16020 [Solirubrobacteraceae bacterium]|jgi:hypothetical protein